MQADGRMRILGRTVPQRLIDPLDAADPDEDRAGRFARDGYLLHRQALDPELVEAAGAAVLARLAAVGEIELPPEVGLATGTSRRRAACDGDLSRFWAEVSNEAALRRVSGGPELAALALDLLARDARPADFVWLRVKGRGIGAPLRRLGDHMRPNDPPALIAWVPLGPIEFYQGPPFVVDGRLDALPDRADLPLHAGAPLRLKTARFEPGDVLFLGPRTAFGAFDNDTRGKRVRVSCECLWRAAEASFDPRFDGPDPAGTDGRGYAGLPASLPLPLAGLPGVET